jgi:hypothetical protein
MQYFINSKSKTELLQIRCDTCEGCDVMTEIYDTYEGLQSSLEACNNCEYCEKHNRCQTVLWEGPVGSLLMDFISLNFDNINTEILKIVENYYEDYHLPPNLEDDNIFWADPLRAEIDDTLSDIHFLFSFANVGDNVVSDLRYYNNLGDIGSLSNDLKEGLIDLGYLKKLDINSFPDLVNQTSFWNYKCLQSIIDECINNQDFFKLITSNRSPLSLFGFGSEPISKTEQINDLKFESMFRQSVTPGNIVQKINEANHNDLYSKPEINEYDISDVEDFILSSISFVLDMGYTFRKCANCSNYFIPENKSDTKYCDRKSPQYPHLSCKEAAKYIKQLEREKSNSTERLRKSIYNTLRNRLDSKKALEDENFYNKCSDDLKNFTTNAAKWKSNIELGKKSEKQYISWLNSFKKRGSKNGEHSESGK